MVWLDTEFFIQNHFLSEFRKGGGLLAMIVQLVSLIPLTFSFTLLAFTQGLIHLGCNILVEEWGTGLTIWGSWCLSSPPHLSMPFPKRESWLGALCTWLRLFNRLSDEQTVSWSLTGGAPKCSNEEGLLYFGLTTLMWTAQFFPGCSWRKYSGFDFCPGENTCDWL